jgi:hypothetical protein
MPVETTERQGANRGESSRVDAPSTGESASAVHGAQPSPNPPPDHRPSRRRRLLIGALGALVLAAVCIFSIPWILASLNTVSTDDAYVNGHVAAQTGHPTNSGTERVRHPTRWKRAWHPRILRASLCRPCLAPKCARSKATLSVERVRQPVERIPACAPRCFPAAARQESAGCRRRCGTTVGRGRHWRCRAPG